MRQNVSFGIETELCRMLKSRFHYLDFMTNSYSYCCRLYNLEVLELRDNSLKMLPLSVTSLNKLRVLDVSSNFINSLVEKHNILHTTSIVEQSG